MYREGSQDGPGNAAAGAGAYSIAQRFPASPRREFQVDRHYLLYAASGTMRLEAEGRVWALPPTRAAMIAAGQPIHVTLPTEVEAGSVLFDTAFIPRPTSALTVVNMTPLARELVLACGVRTGPDVPLTAYARHLFLALAAVIQDLAVAPSRAVMPIPRSPGLARAVALTMERMAEPLRFEAVARAVAMTPRSLARRFEAEMHMTWRESLRRLRIIRSLDLLAAGSSSTEASLAVGYSSLSAFHAAFREVMGETPTSYSKGVAQLAGQATRAAGNGP